MSDSGTIRTLLVEDDRALADVLSTELRAAGKKVVGAETVEEALDQLRQWDYDVALMDVMLPDGSGLEVLRYISSERLPVEAIVLTGHAAVATAIEAMKLGAYDYLTKPVRMEELDLLVQKAAHKSSLRRETDSLRARIQRQDALPGVVTEDPAMKALLATLDRVATSDLPVLVQGESGTGKELVARALHQRSDRAQGPFVAVNCAAVPEQLLESELFGHERGAFTGAVSRKPGLFELAEHGVILLDEIGEIALAVQAKLLRAVESREFFRVGGTRSVRGDARVVSATNKDLQREVQAGRFREDLYYRLNGVTLRLPPLRERMGDIPLLALHFLDRFARGRKSISRRALETLKGYGWPGNVRELEMVIRRAAVLSGGDTIDADELPLDIRDQDWRALLRSGPTLEELEREYIQMALKQNQGHRGRTAKALGIDVKTLYNKLRAEDKGEAEGGAEA
jgi:DNA-binding NtrC family response regulator